MSGIIADTARGPGEIDKAPLKPEHKVRFSRDQAELFWISMKGSPKLRKERGRPFWLPASTYYFLAASIAIAIFFVVWAILNDGREESPWISAGFVSSVSLIGAVIVREIILRSRRENVFRAQKRLDSALLSVRTAPPKDADASKLSLERNSILLEEIRRKSEAAKVLSKLSESHREVFQLCEAYLDIARNELPHIRVGSPRLAAITRGRESAERRHRFHMLKWAEIEARALTQDASESERPTVRLEKAKRALSVVDSVWVKYPDEKGLRDSKQVLEELVFSIKVSNLIEKAERAEAKGNHKRAAAGYREAYDLVQKNAPVYPPSGEFLSQISEKIDRIEKLFST